MGNFSILVSKHHVRASTTSQDDAREFEEDEKNRLQIEEPDRDEEDLFAPDVHLDVLGSGRKGMLVDFGFERGKSAIVGFGGAV